MGTIRCPVTGYKWENSLKRVLAHIHDCHKTEDCPGEFILEHWLVQCPRCCHWYLKLQRHLSGSTCCKSVTSMSSGTNAHADDDTGSKDSAKDSSLQSQINHCRHLSNTGGGVVVEAWRVVDAIPVDHILDSLPPRTIRNIPASLKSMFLDCCCIPLQMIESNPSSDLGWKLLLLLPRMLLQPHVWKEK